MINEKRLAEIEERAQSLPRADDFGWVAGLIVEVRRLQKECHMLSETELGKARAEIARLRESLADTKRAFRVWVEDHTSDTGGPQ